jgi:hypothetical protein
VSMIQAAHVGIGIQGKEGKQASLAADFSVNQFSHIARLLHKWCFYVRCVRFCQGLIILVIDKTVYFAYQYGTAGIAVGISNSHPCILKLNPLKMCVYLQTKDQQSSPNLSFIED